VLPMPETMFWPVWNTGHLWPQLLCIAWLMPPAQSSRMKLRLTHSGNYRRLFIDHKNDVIRQVNDLKDLGISISIDDFGTGYSSRFYLKQLPISQLKIDQTFVADLTTDENYLIIIETIISMAKHLRLEVIAEGVESKQQFQLLNDRGCQYF
jgi:sensor c-di-GMP phosphodiesterase-like protein